MYHLQVPLGKFEVEKFQGGGCSDFFGRGCDFFWGWGKIFSGGVEIFWEGLRFFFFLGGGEKF